MLSYNTPPVAWSTHMSEKTQSNTSGRLLIGLAAVQHASQAGPLTVDSITGVENPCPTSHPVDFDITDYLTLIFYHCSPLLYPYHINNLGGICTLRLIRYCFVTAKIRRKRFTLQRWITSNRKNCDKWMEFCWDTQIYTYLHNRSTTIQHHPLLGFYAWNRRV